MIERIFSRWLTKRITGEQANNYSKDNSDLHWRVISWLLGVWFCLGLFISNIAYEYGMDSSQCGLCNRLAEVFPSIDIAAVKSDYPSVTRIIWLYLTVTTPPVTLGVILTIFLIKFENVSATSLRQLLASILFFIIVCIAGYYYMFVWCGNETRNTTTIRLFMSTISGRYVLGFSFCSSFVLGFFFFLYHHINFFLNR